MGEQGVRSGVLCACGCGEETFLIAHPARARGRIPGQPNRYLNGHWARTVTKPRPEKKASQVARSKRANEARKRRYAEDPAYREELRAGSRRRRATRRARMRAAFVEDIDPLVVLERDDGACGICGGDVDPFRFDVDHVLPLVAGGEHSYANVQAAHPKCNYSKQGDV